MVPEHEGQDARRDAAADGESEPEQAQLTRLAAQPPAEDAAENGIEGKASIVALAVQQREGAGGSAEQQHLKGTLIVS